MASLPSPEENTTFSAKEFFETQDPPIRLSQLLEGVGDFVAHHAKEKRRVVLVTVRGESYWLYIYAQ